MAEQLAGAVDTDDGRHDFDFWFGNWRQVNRKRVKPLVEGDPEWVEFESVSEARPIVAGHSASASGDTRRRRPARPR